MFEHYREIMNPKNGLKDVIDMRVLQTLMQSFYLRERHELMMVHFTRDNSMERIRPFEDESDSRGYFHPFCKAFRTNAACNSLCEACDEQRARALAQRDVKSEVQQYHCHMGLIDCVYPIRLANKTRGVLFAGQRVPVWSTSQLTHIQNRIRQTALERYDQLLPLLMSPDEVVNLPSERGLDNLKKRFATLGETIQKVVEDSYEAKHAKAVQHAVEEASEQLSAVDMRFNWVEPLDKVLLHLEDLLGNAPIVFLIKDRDDYVSKAVSPLAMHLRNVRIEQEKLDFLYADEWKCITPECGDNYLGLRSRLPHTTSTKSDAYKLYCFEKRADNPDTTASLSCIMVVMRHLQSHELELPKECCRIFAHHAHVGLFMEELTFAGHRMKTPIQVALLKLRRASRLAKETNVEGAGIITINMEVVRQLQKALVDADLMETAAREPVPLVDIGKMLTELIPQFETLGQSRRVAVVWGKPVDDDLNAVGDDSEIGIVLSNLLDNAVKYSFAGKEIRISAKRRPRVIEVSIANFGVGIDSEKLDQLFTYGGRVSSPDERFSRTGSGLGLAQAKQLVEKNGGTIKVTFTPVSREESRGVVVATVLLPSS